jgi:Na+-transporting methylmalonyl-CoA/oxaloacetate decarboxylase gamma subunit
MNVFGVIFLVAYLGIVIYFISLLGRLVRAIEKIATKIENSLKI